MNPSNWSRAASLLLAGCVTLSLLLGIESLALPDSPPPALAAGSTARA